MLLASNSLTRTGDSADNRRLMNRPAHGASLFPCTRTILVALYMEDRV
jgi:hypothetical protein